MSRPKKPEIWQHLEEPQNEEQLSPSQHSDFYIIYYVLRIHHLYVYFSGSWLFPHFPQHGYYGAMYLDLVSCVSLAHKIVPDT